MNVNLREMKKFSEYMTNFVNSVNYSVKILNMWANYDWDKHIMV